MLACAGCAKGSNNPELKITSTKQGTLVRAIQLLGILGESGVGLDEIKNELRVVHSTFKVSWPQTGSMLSSKCKTFRRRSTSRFQHAVRKSHD